MLSIHLALAISILTKPALDTILVSFPAVRLPLWQFKNWAWGPRVSLQLPQRQTHLPSFLGTGEPSVSVTVRLISPRWIESRSDLYHAGLTCLKGKTFSLPLSCNSVHEDDNVLGSTEKREEKTCLMAWSRASNSDHLPKTATREKQL